MTHTLEQPGGIMQRRNILLGLTSTALASPAIAQGAWPNRPIRMIVPFTPGAATDAMARLAAAKKADALGVTVGFDSLGEVQAKMSAAVPALGEEGLADYGALPKADSGAKFEGELAGYPIKDFYLTNPIARASNPSGPSTKAKRPSVSTGDMPATISRPSRTTSTMLCAPPASICILQRIATQSPHPHVPAPCPNDEPKAPA